MAYKSRKERKRASGGKAEAEDKRWHEYNAQGSPEAKETHEKDDGFKRGGAHKRAHGGHVEGEKAKHHMGKRARGGKMEEKCEPEERARGGRLHGRARGGSSSPLSSAHRTSPPSNKEGSPGEMAPLS